MDRARRRSTSNKHPAPSRALVNRGLGLLVKSPPAGQATSRKRPRYDGREGRLLRGSITHRTHERKPALLQPTQARAAVTRRKRGREMESGFVATSTRRVIAAFAPPPSPPTSTCPQADGKSDLNPRHVHVECYNPHLYRERTVVFGAGRVRLPRGASVDEEDRH